MGSGERWVRLSAHTSAAPAQVWRQLADPFSYARWVAGTRAIRRADPAWPAVGTRLHHRFGPWPLTSHDCTTVLECEPPRRIVLTARARPFGVVRAQIDVHPEAGGTRVELCERPVGGALTRWPGLGRWVQRLRNRRSLRRLVELAERAGP